LELLFAPPPFLTQCDTIQEPLKPRTAVKTQTCIGMGMGMLEKR
jgi:hypothetical protein